LGVSTLAPANELSRSDRRWLEQKVAVIITEEEAQLFRDLDSKQDRKLFKEIFWARRHPNLITVENELREELERRMRIAKVNFGVGENVVPLPTWRPFSSFSAIRHDRKKFSKNVQKYSPVVTRCH
jgi:hypothetical protein